MNNQSTITMTVSVAELKHLIKQAVESAFSSRERSEQERHNNKVYNTKLLLEHYRLFKEHAGNAVFEIEDIDEEQISAIEILDSMLQTATSKGEIAVESIRNSALRTKIIMKHIDKMLEIYENCCNTSTKAEDRRKWDVIYTVYIKPQEELNFVGKMDIYEDLAEKHFVTVRMIQNDVADACETLTSLFFGADGLCKYEKRKQKKTKNE